MTRRSPQPKKIASRTWIWFVVAFATWSIACIVAIATLPTWSRPWVRDALLEKLSARLEQPVELGELELDYERVVLHDLVVGDPETPIIRLDEVVVDLEGHVLWRGRIDVERVHVTGGRVQGDRATLEGLARKALRRRNPQAPDEERRVRIVPKSLDLADVWIVVDEPDDPRIRHLEARVQAELELATRTAVLTLGDVRVQPRRGPLVTAGKIATTLVVESTPDGPQLVFPLRIDVDDVGAPVTEAIAVAGVDGWVKLSDPAITEVELDLSGGFSDRADDAGARLWSMAGKLRRDLSAGVVRLDMAEFELGRIPEVLEGLPVVESAQATVGGHLSVVFGGGIARLEGDVSLEGLNVNHPVLAKDPVRGIGFDLQFAAEIDPRARRLRLDHAVVEREGVRLALAADIEHTEDRRHRRYRVHASVPAVDCQAVLDAIPRELTPSMQGFVLDGDFEADVRFEADYSDLEAMVLDGKIGMDHCKAKQVPAHASADRLNGSFTHRVTMRDGRERTVSLHDGSGSFTPLESISPHMVQAVLTTEDGGFWRHKGFLPSQFKTAMQRNLAAGKVRLGASTITMQMVKNVLLSHERTLSRKLQEFFLTWYLETALSKQRIMELYLNVIEFGPGIYGVTRAARHYFGKHPGELSPPEAAFLALMLPSPVRRHASWCHGAPTASMQIKLQRILGIMHDRKRLSEEDYLMWKDMPLQFDTTERNDEGSCLAEIDRLLSAQEGQRALSGLLAGGAANDSPEPAPEDEDVVPTPRVKWSKSNDTDEPREPGDVDAPGHPAMDETPPDGETW
jgi:hypothetical protein